MGQMKVIYFSKTNAAYDLKVGGCIELFDLMNLLEYQRSRSLFDLCLRSLGFQTSILLSRPLTAKSTEKMVLE